MASQYLSIPNFAQCGAVKITCNKSTVCQPNYFTKKNNCNKFCTHYFSVLQNKKLISRSSGQYLNSFCSRSEAASDVTSSRFMWLIVPDKWAKFCDPSLNGCEEIGPKAIGGSISDSFSALTSN